MALLTVITPTYNRAEFLEETIESVLSENFPELEFLVIDDGSTDHTSSVVAKYGQKLTYLKHENIGESRTVNKGFRLSQGRFVMIVNSDDPILPGCLSRMVGALAARPDCLAAYPDWQIIDSESRLLQQIRLVDDDIAAMLSRGHVSIGPGACFRRVCFELIGYRDPQLRYSADLDYWFRLALGGRILHVPEILATHRTHPASASVWAKGRRLADETVYALHAYSKHPLLPQGGRHLSAIAIAHAHFAAFFVCDGWQDSARELARSLLANPVIALRRCHAQPVWGLLEHFERIAERDSANLQGSKRRHDGIEPALRCFASALAAPDRMSALRPVLQGILRYPVEMLRLAEQYGFDRLIQHLKSLPSSVRSSRHAPDSGGISKNTAKTDKPIDPDVFRRMRDVDHLASGNGLAIWESYISAGLYQTLGVAEAQRGNYSGAVEHFRNCLRKDSTTPLAAYQLGSCLALQGQFTEANAIFCNDIRIACGDGRFTSSIAMRLPVPDAVGGLQFRRVVDLDPDGLDREFVPDRFEMIYFVCCDSHYLKLFGKAAAESIAQNANMNCAFHVHVVNPDADAVGLLSVLSADPRLSVFFSTEDTDLSHFDENQRRTYYSCARYLVLPDLTRRYKMPILVADIDMLVVKSLRQFFSEAAQSDVGLLKFSREGYNIMAFVSASVVFINRTEAALKFCRDVFRYLVDRMRNSVAVTWHLDQAALVAAHLCPGDARFYFISPGMMLSRVHTGSDDMKLPEEVHFWSVTYSIPQNAPKLDGHLFKQYLEPTAR